jgi:hypothetical protein
MELRGPLPYLDEPAVKIDVHLLVSRYSDLPTVLQLVGGGRPELGKNLPFDFPLTISNHPVESDLFFPRGDTMKKRIFQMGSALLFATLLTAPAGAGWFISDIICNSNNPSATGSVIVINPGTVSFFMKGLPPNSEFICDIECELEGVDVEQRCPSDRKGRISTTIRNVNTCIGPVAEIEDASKQIICASGFVNE